MVDRNTVYLLLQNKRSMSKKLHYIPIEMKGEIPTHIREYFIELMNGFVRIKYDYTGNTYINSEDPVMGLREIHAIEDMYIPKKHIQKISLWYGNSDSVWIIQFDCSDSTHNIHFNMEDHKTAIDLYDQIVKWFVPAPWYKRVGRYMLNAIMFR